MYLVHYVMLGWPTCEREAALWLKPSFLRLTDSKALPFGPSKACHGSVEWHDVEGWAPTNTYITVHCIISTLSHLEVHSITLNHIALLFILGQHKNTQKSTLGATVQPLSNALRPNCCTRWDPDLPPQDTRSGGPLVLNPLQPPRALFRFPVAETHIDRLRGDEV